MTNVGEKTHVALLDDKGNETRDVITVTAEMAENSEGRAVVGSTRFMNDQGDVIVVWTDDKDEKVLASIQAKMDAGYSFFIVEARAFGILPPKKTAITDTKKQKKDILKSRTVEIKDADFDALFSEGKVGVTAAGREGSDIATSGRAESAAEVAKNDTVAVQPRKGG